MALSSVDINLRGPMLCTRAVLPGMMARDRGRIVNIASGVKPYPYLSAYVTSKTALVRFSEILAAETRARGVYVFTIGPGTTRTAMSEHSLTSEEGQRWIPGSGASSQRSWTFRWSGLCNSFSTSCRGVPTRCRGGY